MRIAVMHNPNAGSEDSDGTELIRHMERRGYQVEVHSTRQGLEAALERRPELVAVLGGDGTVGKVARVVRRLGIPIGLIPMGTANNIATSLGLTSFDPDELVASWRLAVPRPFDVGVVRRPSGEDIFLESVGVGVVSETMAAIDEGDHSHVNAISHSESRMVAALAVYRRMIVEVAPCRVELRLDDADLSGDYVLLEALNFGSAGPNLCLAPQADASDGLLDVVIAEEADRHVLCERLELFRTDPEHAPRLRYQRGRRIEIRSHRCRLHIDDELTLDEDNGIDIELSIEPGALSFLCPVLKPPR